MRKGMAKLIVEIPDELHQKLKLKAVKEKTTIKNIVNEMLKDL